MSCCTRRMGCMSGSDRSKTDQVARGQVKAALGIYLVRFGVCSSIERIEEWDRVPKFQEKLRSAPLSHKLDEVPLYRSRI